MILLDAAVLGGGPLGGNQSLQAMLVLRETCSGKVCDRGAHLYLPLMLRFRRAARREGYQMGNVKLPAASAVVFSVTSVSSSDSPRRCHSVDVSPLQNCTCSAVGAPGRMAACKARISRHHTATHMTSHSARMDGTQ